MTNPIFLDTTTSLQVLKIFKSKSTNLFPNNHKQGRAMHFSIDAGRKRIKHLLLAFFLILIFIPSVQAVDCPCPGGQWVHISTNQTNTCYCGGPNLNCFNCVNNPSCCTSSNCKTQTDCSGPLAYVYYCYTHSPEPSTYCCGDQRTDTYECRCTEGQSQSCYTGPAGTQGVGECRAGTQSCTNYQWGTCQSEVLPQTELCGDLKDNDCDGQTDEGFILVCPVLVGGACQIMVLQYVLSININRL